MYKTSTAWLLMPVTVVTHSCGLASRPSTSNRFLFVLRLPMITNLVLPVLTASLVIKVTVRHRTLSKPQIHFPYKYGTNEIYCHKELSQQWLNRTNTKEQSTYFPSLFITCHLLKWLPKGLHTIMIAILSL